MDIVTEVKPDQATLVPEKREEVTTEGGLDVAANMAKIANVIDRLESERISVSLFVDPDKAQIEASKSAGARIIEIHTGRYANALKPEVKKLEFSAISDAVEIGRGLGLVVNAGHGLDYDNVTKIARIRGIEELNIGHSIISRAIFSGIENAVKEMLALIR